MEATTIVGGGCVRGPSAPAVFLRGLSLGIATTLLLNLAGGRDCLSPSSLLGRFGINDYDSGAIPPGLRSSSDGRRNLFSLRLSPRLSNNARKRREKLAKERGWSLLGGGDPKTVEWRTAEEEEGPGWFDRQQQLQLQEQQQPPPQPQQPWPIRDVHVGSMCRCPTGKNPLPGFPSPRDNLDVGIVQPPSLATGTTSAKRYFLHRLEGGCQCVDGTTEWPAPTTDDMFLKKMSLHKCDRVHPPQLAWEDMPDLGVEETLPLFVGVMSRGGDAPWTLNGTLHNWLDHDLFRRIRARDVFVRLNRRSDADDAILQQFVLEQERRGLPSPVTALGSPDEHLHAGRAIADICRRAESHPAGHPNGENLLLFLEEDWNLYGNGGREEEGSSSGSRRPLEALFRGINGLTQRGVPYVRLQEKSPEVTGTWPCPSQGHPFECTTAHQHRWTNQPMVVRCDWFLRYLEPFALLDDPIMYGCKEGMQEGRQCDWEEALSDGRVAWSEGQWIVANLAGGHDRLFVREGAEA